MAAAFPPAGKLKWLAQLAADLTLSGLALRLGVLLATRYASTETGEASPSQSTLCRDLQASPEGIRKAAKMLADRGHLALTPGCGTSAPSRYRPILLELNPQRMLGFSRCATQ